VLLHYTGQVQFFWAFTRNAVPPPSQMRLRASTRPSGRSRKRSRTQGKSCSLRRSRGSLAKWATEYDWRSSCSSGQDRRQTAGSRSLTEYVAIIPNVSTKVRAQLLKFLRDASDNLTGSILLRKNYISIRIEKHFQHRRYSLQISDAAALSDKFLTSGCGLHDRRSRYLERNRADVGGYTAQGFSGPRSPCGAASSHAPSVIWKRKVF
jgi:hypothetical protein